MAFHDLTTHDKAKMNIRTLLGIGPNFCVQPKGTEWKDTILMMHRFKRDERLKNYLMIKFSATDEDVPRLYRNNEK